MKQSIPSRVMSSQNSQSSVIMKINYDPLTLSPENEFKEYMDQLSFDQNNQLWV